MIPPDMGVYIVFRESEESPVFRKESIGGFFRGINPTVSEAILKENWVAGAHVVYIGKAQSLRRRLRAYMRFGNGITAPHWGGRFIWQLEDCDDLLVAWKPLSDEDPCFVEGQLIRRFKARYKKLPFANLCEPR